MDTEQESLFKAMLNNAWFTKSDGDVESPTGYFGWMVNHPSDWFEVAQNFIEVITDPGDMKPPEWFVGVWYASIDSNGIIHIERLGNIDGSSTSMHEMAFNPAVKAARDKFAIDQNKFNSWNEG